MSGQVPENNTKTITSEGGHVLLFAGVSCRKEASKVVSDALERYRLSGTLKGQEDLSFEEAKVSFYWQSKSDPNRP